MWNTYDIKYLCLYTFNLFRSYCSNIIQKRFNYFVQLYSIIIWINKLHLALNYKKKSSQHVIFNVS
jgi:hypothetical protein